MRTGQLYKPDRPDSGVANMIEYVMISGVCTGLLIVMLLLVNAYIMENPANELSYVAFTDIGNGVSTRIVDVYALAPVDGSIATNINLPTDIADKEYFITIRPGTNPIDQDVKVSGGAVEADISLAGIGASRGVSGNTTGRGMKRISYDSGGF
jgi:hypothetical protein